LRLRSPSDRVIEPDRLFAESSVGGNYILYVGGEKLEPEDFPLGRYFYHWTQAENLNLITRQGLSSSKEESWRMKQYGEAVRKGESRLYLVALEYDCLSYIHFSQERLVGLRFRRSIIRDKEKTFDGRYGGHLFSFFVRDTVIAPSELDVCLKQKWVGGKKRIRGEWFPLLTKR
jgi:hypothetical protein